MSAEIISIPRAALHEQVALRLRQMLVESQIPPGAKLNERELAEVLNVSRTPLREAIKMLAAEGLVQHAAARAGVGEVVLHSAASKCKIWATCWAIGAGTLWLPSSTLRM